MPPCSLGETLRTWGLRVWEGKSPLSPLGWQHRLFFSWGGMKESCWAVSSLSKRGFVPPPSAASYVGTLSRVTLTHLSLRGGLTPAQPRRGMNRLQGYLEQDPQESGPSTKPDRAQYVFEQPSQELGGILVIVQGRGLDLMTPVGCFQLRKFSNSMIPWFDLSLPIRTKTRLQIFRVNGRSPPDFRSLRTLHYF